MTPKEGSREPEKPSALPARAAMAEAIMIAPPLIGQAQQRALPCEGVERNTS